MRHADGNVKAKSARASPFHELKFRIILTIRVPFARFAARSAKAPPKFTARTRRPGPSVRITSIDIRVCQNTRPAMSDSEMRSGGKSTFDFLVITMKTDEGIEGLVHVSFEAEAAL